jgi:hypothetical protein
MLENEYQLTPRPEFAQIEELYFKNIWTGILHFPEKIFLIVY